MLFRSVVIAARTNKTPEQVQQERPYLVISEQQAQERAAQAAQQAPAQGSFEQAQIVNATVDGVELVSRVGEQPRTEPRFAKSYEWKVAKEVAENLNSKEWYSTQETGYCLLAMCKYADGNGGSKNINFEYTVNGISSSKKSKSKICQVKISDNDIVKKGNVSVKNNGDVVLYAKLMVEGIPSIGDQSSAASNLSAWPGARSRRERNSHMWT